MSRPNLMKCDNCENLADAGSSWIFGSVTKNDPRVFQVGELPCQVLPQPSALYDVCGEKCLHELIDKYRSGKWPV